MQDALDTYYRRLRLQEEPKGKVKFGFWFPAEEEQRACCDIRFKQPVEPGQIKHWNILLHHCRTVAHVANLHGVDPRLMMDLVKEITGEM